MEKKIYQVQIALKGFKPKIWRRLLVPSNILLPEFHEIIQVSMGWTNSHLHQFIKNDEYYGMPFEDDFDDFPINDYRKIKLDFLLNKEKDKLIYEYDFGDSWQHNIILEKILPYDDKIKYPVCLSGKMNCPPEDCGGVWAYSDMLEILKQPDHEEYETYIEWLGGDFDPEYFDKDKKNELLTKYFAHNINMTTKEFWEKYKNKDILEVFDIACDFFSKKLPQEFVDNYDVGDVILEISGRQENEKNFDNVLKFTKILQKHQPAIYKKYFQYFDDFLVDYFCFYLDSLKVKQSFLNFLENPLQDYDVYLRTFKKLMFYQHTEILDMAISKNFNTICESDDLIIDSEYDLAICKFYTFLQEIYLNGDKNFDKTKFLAKIAEYDFEVYDNFFPSLETGLIEQPMRPDELKKMFTTNKKWFFIVVQEYFLRYMHEKGFEFYLSGKIWDNMMLYWGKNNKKNNINQYFNIKESSFERYLSKFAGDFVFDNTSELIAILWGSVYVCDFLNKYNLISEQQFHDFIEISRKLKGKVIGQLTPALWNSNFVHYWNKPDCISETEFAEENKIFQKSINFKYEPFNNTRSYISEELSKIGELSKFIIDGGNDINNNDASLLKDLFDFYLNGIDEIDEYDNPKNTSVPISVEKKVGTNDPCPCGSGKKYKNCCGKK